MDVDNRPELFTTRPLLRRRASWRRRAGASYFSIKDGNRWQYLSADKLEHQYVSCFMLEACYENTSLLPPGISMSGMSSDTQADIDVRSSINTCAANIRLSIDA